MKRLRTIVLLLLTFLAGCQQMSAREFETGRVVPSDLPKKQYDSPVQVIYRIDDYRFVTLENYDHCFGDTWYNDTHTGVRTLVDDMWVGGFLGKLIIDDPTGMNVVIPKVSTNLCGDRGCMNYAAYSTDGGRTFNWMQYDRDHISYDSVEASKEYTFSVTADSLYITRKWGNFGDTLTDRYPLGPGYVYGKNARLPEGVTILFSTTLPKGLHSPSGQDHYVCDASIRPTNRH